MEESLTEELNKAATEAHDAFPEKLKNFVVIDPFSKKTLVYVAPEIAKYLSENIAYVKETIEYTTNYFQNQETFGFSYPSFPLNGKTIELIALNTNIKGNYPSKFIGNERKIAHLKHEIGHFVVKGGLSITKEHLAECLADTYAALQQIQNKTK